MERVSEESRIEKELNTSRRTYNVGMGQKGMSEVGQF
jgi:hypothetical protein